MNAEFWDFFNIYAAPKLAAREASFRRIFTYLDGIQGPILIVETGCARTPGNWDGDGQSTVLFDKYISARDRASRCLSVDINPESVEVCKRIVSARTVVSQDDSVHFLNLLTQNLVSNGEHIHFLYLDSFDLDFDYWQPSAIHHLKELTAAMRAISKDTLVVVDDCLLTGHFSTVDDRKIEFSSKPKIGGKGRLVGEFATACGAKLEFSGYQAGWTGFNPST
jgi:hypothetical protein